MDDKRLTMAYVCLTRLEDEQTSFTNSIKVEDEQRKNKTNTKRRVNQIKRAKMKNRDVNKARRKPGKRVDKDLVDAVDDEISSSAPDVKVEEVTEENGDENNSPKRKRRVKKERNYNESDDGARKYARKMKRFGANVYCFICEDEPNTVYPSEKEFFDHCTKQHLHPTSNNLFRFQCAKCDKNFRGIGVSSKSYLRAGVTRLLSHMVEKHATPQPDWAPVYT